MELSKRLQASAGLISEGNRLVDVGTDHGYVPIYLVKHEKIPSAIAMDVKRGPLSRAEEHIKQAGLGAYIECRLSDGLKELKPGEGDSLLLAGMGGNLMVRILMEKPETLASFRELVLQPQSAHGLVRRQAEALEWRVDREDMVLEDGKFYPMLRLVPAKWKDEAHGTGCLETEYENEAEYTYGKLLLRERHPVLKVYLEKQRDVFAALEARLKEQIKTDGSKAAGRRLLKLEQETAVLKEALAYYR